jgi:hypothetical protein
MQQAARPSRALRARAVIVKLLPTASGLDQMFAELETATRDRLPDLRNLVAIAAKYDITIKPPSA